MAFNSHHSATWSDGHAGNNSINASGDTNTISWADIEKSLDKSSLAGSNYGRGELARTSDAALSTTATVEAAPATGDKFAFAGGGFGLVQAGVSPFRGLDPNGEFFSNPNKRYQDVRSNFQTTETLAPAEPTIGTAPKLNSSLLRVIGNLGKRDGATPTGELSLPNRMESSTPEAKFAIGLAISTDDADVHQPGKVARAVVRLPEAAPTAEPSEKPAPVEAKVELPKEPEVNPIGNPFKYVGDQRAAILEKFDPNNVKYGRTTLLPDGRVVEVQTAQDNTTLTNTKGEHGANSMVVHDRYRRPVTEQHTDSDGTWSFSNLSYNDANGIKPFCSEKLTVNSDGSVVKMKYTSMGQIESKHTFA